MATRKGASRTNHLISHLDGVVAAVQAKGHAIQATAETIFAEHDNPGGHSIVGERQDTDYLVSIEGPKPHVVEFGREGYITGPDYRAGAGVEVGPAEGLHILGRAVDANDASAS